ncbi:MAG: hypothetical protein JXA69_13910 [Phycisphaerae bacterium]|nr:hypothetical protein [Phycisphaerae bacterium]
MSKPDLQIELSPGPWPGHDYAGCWPVGGRIAGTLRAQTFEPVKARGVRVELGWHTEGRGDTDKKVVDTVTVQEGSLHGPQAYQWTFELAVPSDGPISYHGHYINILWQVRAVVDMPWARDAKAEQPVQILPDYAAD